VLSPAIGAGTGQFAAPPPPGSDYLGWQVAVEGSGTITAFGSLGNGGIAYENFSLSGTPTGSGTVPTGGGNFSDASFRILPSVGSGVTVFVLDTSAITHGGELGSFTWNVLTSGPGPFATPTSLGGQGDYSPSDFYGTPGGPSAIVGLGRSNGTTSTGMFDAPIGSTSLFGPVTVAPHAGQGLPRVTVDQTGGAFYYLAPIALSGGDEGVAIVSDAADGTATQAFTPFTSGPGSQAFADALFVDPKGLLAFYNLGGVPTITALDPRSGAPITAAGPNGTAQFPFAAGATPFAYGQDQDAVVQTGTERCMWFLNTNVGAVPAVVTVNQQ
jgi:hypothetical protein